MDGSFDSTTWTAVALTLTAVGGVLSFLAFRRRGAASGLKGLAWTLLPLAALLTGTLRLLVAIGSEVATWASRLVFSPPVWAGVIVAGVAVLLWVTAGAMSARGIGVRERPAGRRARRAAAPAPDAAAPVAARGRKPARGSAPAEKGDEDMDEVEAILRKHGI